MNTKMAFLENEKLMNKVGWAGLLMVISPAFLGYVSATVQNVFYSAGPYLEYFDYVFLPYYGAFVPFIGFLALIAYAYSKKLTPMIGIMLFLLLGQFFVIYEALFYY